MNLSDLYQDVILDHNQNPRNFHVMDDADNFANGFNPLCGDRVTVYLKIRDDKIVAASFQGCGCAISTASASLLTDALHHKTVAEAKQLFRDFQTAVTEDTENAEALGKLQVLLGVKEFPARVKCATLAWHTLMAALKSGNTVVSTE